MISVDFSKEDFASTVDILTAFDKSLFPRKVLKAMRAFRPKGVPVTRFSGTVKAPSRAYKGEIGCSLQVRGEEIILSLPPTLLLQMTSLLGRTSRTLYSNLLWCKLRDACPVEPVVFSDIDAWHTLKKEGDDD